MRDEEADKERERGGEREGAVAEEPARVEPRPARDPQVGGAEGSRRSPEPRQQRRRDRSRQDDERAADEDLPPQPVRRAVRRRNRPGHRSTPGREQLTSLDCSLVDWSCRGARGREGEAPPLVRRCVVSAEWGGDPRPRETAREINEQDAARETRLASHALFCGASVVTVTAGSLVFSTTSHCVRTTPAVS